MGCRRHRGGETTGCSRSTRIPARHGGALLALFVLMCCVPGPEARAQQDPASGLQPAASDPAPAREYICFPKAMPPWTFEKTLGFSLAYIPKAIAEEEINYSPLVDFQARLGLPYQFSATARISTIGITNHLQFGGQWSFSLGRFSAAVGYDASYWLGWFEQEAFNVVANGTMNYPFVSVGWDFGDFFVSLRSEAQLSTFWETFVGEASVGGTTWELVGFAFTYALEQPLWGNTHIVQCVKINYTKFFYQSWISFSTIDRYIIYPEFIVGIHL